MGKPFFGGKFTGWAVALAALLSIMGCATVRLNKDYSGDRFPSDFAIMGGKVDLSMKDAGGMAAFDEPDRKKVWAYVIRGFAENTQGFKIDAPDALADKEAGSFIFFSPDGGTHELVLNAIRGSAAQRLYEDAAKNEKTGTIADQLIDNDYMREAFVSGPRYIAFFEYSGYMLRDGYRTAMMAADTASFVLSAFTGISSPSFDSDDDSTFILVLIDKENKKYVYWDMIQNHAPFMALDKEKTAMGYIETMLGRMKSSKDGK
jgi:hypothetical protein